MRLQGSCRCGAVSFEVNSRTPYPFMRCYCGICRKTDGGGGYAINIMGDFATLKVEGEDAISMFHAETEEGVSPGERRFCKHCGSALWVYDPRWPELVHPFASAIDTPLPLPPETVHIMLDFKPDWVEVPEGENHRHYPGYPEQSIEDWHRAHGLLLNDPSEEPK
ncbi:GFA family protein [Stappia sp. GBMRC 2046]|uniref:GFA family protein n=1 Tax=Stappia sediminis TaxID=2692190 RepID=A0A7X3LSH1_9HYPH|nr:GFA family protein [Stappia sediminis]MXN64287.1 GFA family protein [Stappia sediminis]